MAAAAVTYLKKTHQEVVAKVQGDSGSVTINLATNLLPAAGQQLLSGGTPTVNITGVTWTGVGATDIHIDRNNVRVMTLPGGASIGQLLFDGQTMVPETSNNTSNIVVTITGGQGEVWLRLHKIAGYQTTIEPEQFGHYDNPAVAGS